MFEEARSRARVARRASRNYFNEECITVAIVQQVNHFLGVAARCAFVPIFLAAAAPKNSFAYCNGAPQALRVHPRHHQHVVGVDVLNDCGDEASVVIF